MRKGELDLVTLDAGLLAKRVSLAGAQADDVYSIWPSIQSSAPKLKDAAASTVLELANQPHAVMWCEASAQ